MARGLPFQLSAASTLGTLLLLVPERITALWVFFGLDVFLAVALVASFLRTTRSLANTTPEERGKRSDDKALAKAQRSPGCLPYLLAVPLLLTLFSKAPNQAWSRGAWYVALGGLLGHLAGVILIQWARNKHRQ